MGVGDIEPEVQVHMESEADRQQREELDVEEYRWRVEVLPYWVCQCLDMDTWGRRHYYAPEAPPPAPKLRYRVDADSLGATFAAERQFGCGDWQEVRQWSGNAPEPLDVCEAIVRDCQRIRITPGWSIGSVSVTDEPYRDTDTDQREQLMAEAAEIVSLVCRKGDGYGDSFRSPTGALADTLFENSTRLHQKAMRLYWLTRAWSRDETFDEENESVEDTLRDLAGYCLLLLTEMRARHGE